MIKFDFDQGLLKEHHKRVKTPSILQMDSMECGAVCLSIILAYYGLHITSEVSREACGVTRDGSKAINMIKAARNFGMNAEGKRINNLNTLNFVQTPFIIFWKFEHFLVIEGIIKNKVYINDPATGPRIITLEELDKGFTGVVISIHPGEQFKPSGKKEKSVFGLLRDYVKGDSLELTYLLLTSALLTIPQASLALFIEFFIDNILIKDQRHWMLGFSLSIIFIIICSILLLWIQQYYLLLYKLRFSIKNIPKFFYKLLHLPMSFYIQRSAGDIANRLYIFDEISENITTGFSEAIIHILSIIIYLLLITIINMTLGIITIFITIINMASIVITQRIIVDLGRRFSQDQAKMHSVEYSGVMMIETLKFMSGENRFFTRWLNYKSKLIDSEQRIDMYNAYISLLPNTLYFLNLVLMIILGCYFVMNGIMTVGSVIAVYTLILLLPEPVRSIVDNFLKINQLKANLIRVNDVIVSYKPQENIGKFDNIDSENLIDIKDIYFGYSKLEAPILSDINISIKRGHTIALTGISGGGKSSLLNLVSGIYEPWFGEIYLLGKNIKNYQKDELFHLISYVDQNIFLFEGTIRENLTMWDKTIDDETIIDALKTACVYDVVTLKGGLDYQILEGGKNISLGQAQRIELARALIKKPSLILLDEATSALDSVTEAQIYRNLHKLNCSFIICAHRLSAIRHSNEIIVIENGGIIERGEHKELMKINGKYKQFIEKDYLL